MPKNQKNAPACLGTYAAVEQARVAKLLGTREVAQGLGITQIACGNKLRRYGVPYYRVGKQAKYYAVQDLERFGLKLSSHSDDPKGVRVKPGSTPDLLSVKDVANLLGESEETARKRLDDASVPYEVLRRRGKPRQYRLADVQAALTVYSISYLEEATGQGPIASCCKKRKRVLLFAIWGMARGISPERLKELLDLALPLPVLKQVMVCQVCTTSWEFETKFKERRGGPLGPVFVMPSTKYKKIEE